METGLINRDKAKKLSRSPFRNRSRSVAMLNTRRVLLFEVNYRLYREEFLL